MHFLISGWDPRKLFSVFGCEHCLSFWRLGFRVLVKLFLLVCSFSAPNTVQRRRMHIHWWTSYLVLPSWQFTETRIRALLKTVWECSTLNIIWCTICRLSGKFGFMLCLGGRRAVCWIWPEKYSFLCFGHCCYFLLFLDTFFLFLPLGENDLASHCNGVIKGLLKPKLLLFSA